MEGMTALPSSLRAWGRVDAARSNESGKPINLLHSRTVGRRTILPILNEGTPLPPNAQSVGLAAPTLCTRRPCPPLFQRASRIGRLPGAAARGKLEVVWSSSPASGKRSEFSEWAARCAWPAGRAGALPACRYASLRSVVPAYFNHSLSTLFAESVACAARAGGEARTGSPHPGGSL